MECIVRYEGGGTDLDLPAPIAKEGDHLQVTGKVISQREGKGLNNAVIGKFGRISESI